MNIHEMMSSHLAVGVGIGAAHQFTAIFKHLDPLVGLAQLCDLIGPFVNDPANLR